MEIRNEKRIASLLGIVSVVAGLASAQLIDSFGTSLKNPIISLGNRVIDYVPTSIKEFAIRTFGTNDKSALVISILIVLLALSAQIGKLYFSSSQKKAYLLIYSLAGIAAIASLFDAGANPFSLLPSIVAGLVTVLILRLFEKRLVTSDVGGIGWNRRELFKTIGIIGVSTVVATSVGRFFQSHASAQLQRLNIILPEPLKFLPSPPMDPALTTPGLSTLFTSNKEFYRIDTAISVPNIDVDSWRLKIGGFVNNPLEFTYKELSARPLFELDDTIACVSNEVGGTLVGNARWLGVRLDDLISEARPSSTADQIMGYSSDGFSAGFPLAALDGRDAMIAIGMNGEPLPLEHGFPARIIVPGLYGYVSATKWLTFIELTRFDKKQGYWVPRGWSAQAPIKTQSRIDTPQNGSNLTAGEVAIAGVAWAPTRGITRVEVRVNNEPWRDATLGPELARTTWRQWWIKWSATPGQASISVRATDGTGATQSSNIVPIAPNGAEGWHTISVSVN
ncbi:MAG: molybdopterin-dependent oxidoreductase [Candidatus Nanopelagicaceae bacterium]|nr:molybdopterin-dependent oxidoreductase [Candidatus Nanopelagicaceae bacterium]